MNETTGKSKSRLGRNLSALLNHSEESLIKTMRWKGGDGNGHKAGVEEEPLPIPIITLPSTHALLEEPSPQFPPAALYQSVPESAAPEHPATGAVVEEEWSVRPAENQPNVLYQISFQNHLLAPEEDLFHLAVRQAISLEVALQLPLLRSTQPVPPVVSRMHVYLLLFDAEKGQRVRLETNSSTIEPGKQNYDFHFQLDGMAPGRWDLAVQVYAALYDFAERRVLRLQVA
ncbi:MAG TPA: hypothetical protein PLG50_14025 [bacterium]|nr:hypothetical protein [bacterium]HQG46773.1 hypothetical protein [bacterium]HQJ64580.1 hypothetical protein [bacterium]